MNIRPSVAIRQNYNEIAEICRKTAEPVFLTKNGEGDFVVMGIETFNRRELRRDRVRDQPASTKLLFSTGQKGCSFFFLMLKAENMCIHFKTIFFVQVNCFIAINNFNLNTADIVF